MCVLLFLKVSNGSLVINSIVFFVIIFLPVSLFDDSRKCFFILINRLAEFFLHSIRQPLPMAEARQSDAMKNLVNILVGLAILGIVIALVVYFIIVLPNQPIMVHLPMNFD